MCVPHAVYRPKHVLRVGLPRRYRVGRRVRPWLHRQLPAAGECGGGKGPLYAAALNTVARSRTALFHERLVRLLAIGQVSGLRVQREF